MYYNIIIHTDSIHCLQNTTHCLQQHLFISCVQLRVTAEAQCEASYFNPQLSVWEPLLEPLVLKNESLKPWSVHAEVTIANIIYSHIILLIHR